MVKYVSVQPWMFLTIHAHSLMLLRTILGNCHTLPVQCVFTFYVQSVVFYANTNLICLHVRAWIKYIIIAPKQAIYLFRSETNILKVILSVSWTL